MSLGFKRAGYDVMAGYDSWKPALEVYRTNLKHDAILCDLSQESVVGEIIRRRADVIVGGPPCQDFSSARPGNSKGHRANLTAVFCSIVCRARPDYFVFENVPRARLSRVYKKSLTEYKKAGYGLTQAILDASHCGVPQTRKRLFLIGALDTADGFLEPFLAQGQSANPLSMSEYFGPELDIAYYFRVPTNYSRRGIFPVDEPSTTIRAIDRPIPSGYRKHKNDPVDIRRTKIRGLTVEERARVQTFPKSFRLIGTKTDLNTMIGNAVPVNLAKHVAKALKKYIEE